MYKNTCVYMYVYNIYLCMHESLYFYVEYFHTDKTTHMYLKASSKRVYVGQK